MVSFAFSFGPSCAKYIEVRTKDLVFTFIPQNECSVPNHHVLFLLAGDLDDCSEETLQ